MGLGAIAAGRHGAPAPSAALAVVDEKPKTAVVGTLAHFRPLRTGEQITSGPQHGHEQRRNTHVNIITNIITGLHPFTRGDTPEEPIAARRDAVSHRREPECPIEPREILVGRFRSRGDGSEDGKDRLTQVNRFPKRHPAPVRPRRQLPLKGAGTRCRHQAIGPTPIHQRREIGKRLGRLGTTPPTARIGKTETKAVLRCRDGIA